MYINTEPKGFVPKNFIVLNFYGTDTCFSWNENEFICFPYLQGKCSTPVLNVLKAPAKIKDIREFSQRVFILCYPTGIYKLTENYEFALLSKAGIELGSSFYEVFTPSNGMFILENKKQKSTKKLCTITEDSDINVLSLNIDNTDTSFYEIILSSECKNADSFCLFAYDEKVFKICEQSFQIMYKCNYPIKNIRPIEKKQKVSGIILQTNTDIVILMQIVEKKLRYDKIHLNASIQSLCAMYIDMDNVIFFVYSDGVRMHYVTKMPKEDSLQEVKSEEKHYQSFRLYQSKFIIFLNSSGELSQVNIEDLVKIDNEKRDSFIELKSNMLDGIEGIIEVMSNKTMELKELQEEIEIKEDTLKRINLFSSKEYLNYCPQDSITRISKQVFLISNFRRILPKNSVIVKMLKSREKTMYAMKVVKDEMDTVVEMPITLTNLSPNLYTTTDLVTHRSPTGVWCLMKNYVKDPLPSETSQIHLASDKRKFIKYKLLVLENMIKKNRVNMEELSKIKREIRAML